MSTGKKFFWLAQITPCSTANLRVWDSEPVAWASLAVQLTSCVTLDKVLNLSEIHFLIHGSLGWDQTKRIRLCYCF